MILIKKFDYFSQYTTPWHQHTAGQLYQIKRGVIAVETEKAQWSVTAGTLGWFPPGNRHRAVAIGAVEGISFYLDLDDCNLFPSSEGIYGADPFVLNLLDRTARRHDPDDSKEYKSSLMTLLGREIMRSPKLALNLPLPDDRRARNVADALLKNPECSWDQEQLALKWGLSSRHLSRLFRQQTGLSFSQWRQQAKIIASLPWVLAGQLISEIAERSGYRNVSAYIEAFKKRFGQTPGQFQINRRITTSSPK
ncbi:putative transcriptional regulator [Xenorhabdus poinarii G6]|uniref:Arabinose operon regulatory protein n=2 Tax=Xenorhabdus poinarii TaxID=40577 RepID=A0A068R7E6_9GAMM|nr:putative transcriptional regulator [Xenorhabdus poinarii G6]